MCNIYRGWRIYNDADIYIEVSNYELIGKLSNFLDRMIENRSETAINYIGNIIGQYNIKYIAGCNFIEFQHDDKLGEITYADGYYNISYGMLYNNTCNRDSILYCDYAEYYKHICDERYIDNRLNDIIDYFIL